MRDESDDATSLARSEHCKFVVRNNDKVFMHLSPSPFVPLNPNTPPATQTERLSRIAQRMQRTGQWSDAQAAGRRWTVGCVSLEITQRCNLDCTLCYLSDSAEAVRDIPIEDLFRRIDDIAVQFGLNTDVQISGGDPTLRDRAELSQIIRYVRAKGLRASLFTNGILLNRAWLSQLASDGLNDVAFHVDMTQQRKGFASEQEMNAIRMRYIEMARGLPVSVIFNTTVFANNMHEIAALANFFIQHNDVVRFASFQLGADTGRGVIPGRDTVAVTQRSVCEAISQGAGVTLNFDALHGGHSACNRYAMLFTIGKRRFDALSDSTFVARVMRDTANVAIERGQGLRGAWELAKAVLNQRQLWGGFIKHTARMFWQARGEWFSNGLRVPPVRKISFFTHNFMDACDLDTERIDACVFMAATVDGPMSMCAYNAERDNYLLKPIRLASGETWQPLAVVPASNGEIKIPLKWLKGKPRELAMSERKKKMVVEETL
jgi:7,8-dihydro-6-hydroxymethylpterin dimethyltransferase